MLSRLLHAVRLLALVLGLLVCLWFGTSPTEAQKKDLPKVTPNPLAPTLAMPFPLGAQPGSSIDLLLTGTNLANPTGLWTSFPCKVTIPTDNNNGKDPTKLLVRLEVPKDVPIGPQSLRLATVQGISNVRLFCIDDLPPLVSTEKNRSRATAQAVPVPCVVAGRVAAESADYYKITVAAGQRFSFDVLGRRIGSFIDPLITLSDAKTGRDLPHGYNNDSPGLQTDARLTYTFKEAGDYLIEVRDVLYRGGADYAYRLRIGDFPCATTPIPMAAKRGSKVNVDFAGTAVDKVAPVSVSVPTDPFAEMVWVAPRGPSGLFGWPVPLAISDVDEIVEQEPNDPAKPTPVPLPGGATGRFQQKGDIDYFTFSAKKGQKLNIDAETLELSSPSEVYLSIRDKKGAELAKTNPAAAAATLSFTAPADGDFLLAVEHLHGWGGPAESYHLVLSLPQPGFDLVLPLDRWDVPQGAAAAIPVQAVRRDYNGPIELTVVGEPKIKGKKSIPAGQAVATLIVTADADAAMRPYFLSIQGQADIDGRKVTVPANVRAVMSQNLGGLPFPPRDLNRQVAFAVTERPPFLISARFEHPDLLRGLPAPLIISVMRASGFDEEILLTPVGLPPNTPPPPVKSIPKGQNEVKTALTPAANAPLGEFSLLFSGKAKIEKKEVTVSSLPVDFTIALPFELKVEPAVVKAAPGDKVKLKVSAIRKGGYAGPIALEVRNLPAGVTAGKAALDQGQNDAVIELALAANAAPGDKADVNVLGTAADPAKSQNASPNFTVTVEKK